MNDGTGQDAGALHVVNMVLAWIVFLFWDGSAIIDNDSGVDVLGFLEKFLRKRDIDCRLVVMM